MDKRERLSHVQQAACSCPLPTASSCLRLCATGAALNAAFFGSGRCEGYVRAKNSNRHPDLGPTACSPPADPCPQPSFNVRGSSHPPHRRISARCERCGVPADELISPWLGSVWIWPHPTAPGQHSLRLRGLGRIQSGTDHRYAPCRRQPSESQPLPGFRCAVRIPVWESDASFLSPLLRCCRATPHACRSQSILASLQDRC